MPFLCALASALLTGVLFAAAFPPFNQWWLAWLWALPLFWRLWQPVPLRGWRWKPGYGPDRSSESDRPASSAASA